MSDVLRYRGYHVQPEDLALGECTVRPTRGADGALYWLFWFYDPRDTDGLPEMFGVPVNPNGGWVEDGPGGKTWGFARTGVGTWQVSPSINVLQTRETHPGEHETIGSLWHHTPQIVGVPDAEPWMNGPPQ